MKDFLGNELSVGDTVVFVTHTRTSSSLRKGVVEGFTPKFVKLDWGRVSPYKVVKI